MKWANEYDSYIIITNRSEAWTLLGLGVADTVCWIFPISQNSDQQIKNANHLFTYIFG